MLTLRQIIPAVTMRALHATAQAVGAPLAEGRVVRAWDYKQKRALVIAFVHAECGTCAEWVAELRGAAGSLAEWDATALVVFSGAPDASMLHGVPANVVMGLDVTGVALRAFLGNDAIDRAGQNKVGVFVTDRYGELVAQWVGAGATGANATGDAHGGGRSKDLPLQHGTLPATKDVMSAVVQVQVACG